MRLTYSKSFKSELFIFQYEVPLTNLPKIILETVKSGQSYNQDIFLLHLSQSVMIWIEEKNQV